MTKKSDLDRLKATTQDLLEITFDLGKSLSSEEYQKLIDLCDSCNMGFHNWNLSNFTQFKNGLNKMEEDIED